MYVSYEGERLYLSAWEYNAARVLTELARIVKNNGGTVAPKTPALIINRNLEGTVNEYTERLHHLQTLQVEIGYNETRAAAIVTYSEKLQELQKVDNTPIKTGYISYFSFVLDGNYYYYYQIDENPFFDFHYIKTPVKSGRRSCDAIYKNDKKEWVADCFFTSFCTNEEVKTAAGYIFDMLTSAPVSKIRLDTKRRRVPNLYDGGYHYETVAAPERFSKIDFLEGC